MKIKVFILLVLTLLPAISHAWWNDDWKFRKKLSLNTTAAGANLANSMVEVPLLVRLHTGNFGYFLDLKQDGSDIRFIAGDDKTPLKFHIERFDLANEMALVWVKLPQLLASSNTDFIWMYYGNPNEVAATDGNGTFDASQALVYHFDSNGTVTDATAYGNNPGLFNALISPASIIGPGARFDGANQIAMSVTPTLRVMPLKGWTFSSWLKFDASQDKAMLFQLKDGEREISLSILGTALVANVKLSSGIQQTPNTNILNPGSWNHIAFSLANNRASLLINGAEVAALNVQLEELAGMMSIGGSVDNANFFVGEMDEVRISNAGRSTDWVKAQYASQTMDSRLLAYGEDEAAQGSGSGSYFTVILQNVTIDGWVVIVLLVIMAAISWVVMILKGMYIGRVRKDNRAFLQAFKQVGSEDLTKLDAADSEDDKTLAAAPVTQALFGKHDHYQSSTLYHLYHTGMQEVNRRVGHAVGAQVAALSTQAIDTIRADLDAALVRERQKLDGQMVLLTIAISGGPFLGLLGTVVGVMITFAAIAASGDVNINAIAPGIAAALVATVAGLAVAIPALFGYNYLGSRIKEISADMQVFIDELVTRLAEQHSE